MANDVIKQIADNIGVRGYDDTSLLIGIAEMYGVDIDNSLCLMHDILEAIGGNARRSINYMEDIVLILGGDENSQNVIEEWERITTRGRGERE
jgi:hypothetical protein